MTSPARDLKRGIVLLMIVAFSIVARSGAAQERTASPHGRLQEECSLCHSPRGWTPAHVGAGFDHAKWGFPLEGAHTTTSCIACHTALDFAGAPRDCVACHQDIHQGELGSDCSRCHTPRSFVDRAAMVRQHQAGRFPLEGVHRIADCEACHTVGGQGGLFTFASQGTRCEDCHLPAYVATTNPPHESSGFPRDCAQCHAVTVWTASRYNHNDTGFPLTGRHRSITCEECHTGGSYQGTPTSCVGCHQQEYDATTAPAHAPAGFPTDCAACHGTSTWIGAAFDHGKTAFPLTGVHRTTPCADCHENGQYTGTPVTCIGCHQDDYDATVNPNHLAAGFNTDCTTCHNTNGWSGANFNHDGNWFPIYRGSHRGQWASCATCHPNSASYAEFTCLSCHEHNQTSMDSKHRGRSAYRYDSQACLSCHPNGQGD